MKQESPSFKSMDILWNEGLHGDLTMPLCLSKFSVSDSTESKPEYLLITKIHNCTHKGM